MPFLGQDPRGPGFSWHKSEAATGGWNVFESNQVVMEATPRSEVRKAIGAYLQQLLDKKHRSLYTTLTAAPHSKCSVKENTKWIQISRSGSKEIHGYTTIGELIRRLDFEASSKDDLRFKYILRVLELLVYHRLMSLSGSALTHLFDLIEQCLNYVLDTCIEIRAMHRLLHHLMASLQRQSRDHLFSSKCVWLKSVARVRHWERTLNNINVPRRVDFGLTLSDLPMEIQQHVAMSLTDDGDVISLSQVNSSFNAVCEENTTWKNLCSVNFEKAQVARVVMEIDHGVCDYAKEADYSRLGKWKVIYFALKSQFEPIERNYQHGLLLCKSCSILFWQECGHPCIRPDTEPADVEEISPLKLVSLF